MQMKASNIRVLSLASALLYAMAPVEAHAQKINFKKADNTVLTTVDLAPNTSVQILANGDIDATCVDANNDSKCDSIPTGGGGTPPVIGTFTRSSATVTPGTNFTLTWSATGADVCLASANPTNAGWTGPKLVSGTATVNYPTALATPAQLALTCYAENASADGVVSVAVEGTSQPPPTGACTRSGPLINPTGYSNSGATWVSLFGKPFPPDARTVQNITLGTKQFASLPFTTAVNRTYRVETLPLYEGAYSDAMFMSISDCAGDFRGGVPNPPVDDHTLTTTCRIPLGPEASTSFTTDQSADPGFNCVLQPNKTYYMNLMMAYGASLVPSCGGSTSCTMPFNVK